MIKNPPRLDEAGEAGIVCIAEFVFGNPARLKIQEHSSRPTTKFPLTAQSEFKKERGQPCPRGFPKKLRRTRTKLSALLANGGLDRRGLSLST
jgi:hypothetical protein